MNQAQLKEILSYSPENGKFTWIANSKFGVKRAGHEAGTLANGYVQICIKKKFHYAHRLAWLYMHGELPTNVIDHINGNKSDNRISNLRSVTQSENLQNQSKPQRQNPHLGVSKNAAGNWRVRIKIGKENIHIGTFKDQDLAKDAYMFAKKKHHISSIYKE